MSEAAIEQERSARSGAGSAAAFVLVLLATAVLAWLPRSVPGLRHDYADGSSWFSRDPDGLYHARRVERALDEGRVAETDPRLDFPHGAAIPWPPYYDRALAWALAPLAPDGEERWRWIERTVSSLPRLFGVASALLAAFAAWRLGGWLAAFVAGAGVALCRGAINYGVIGTGDHHAWISLLSALSFALACEAVRAGALESPRRGAAWGLAIGAVVGVLIGSWVASLLFLVIPLQFAFAIWIAARGSRALPGLATFGFATHAAATLVLLPAVLSSPWREEHPWMVVNLSWFHFAQLALGAAVFVPLFARRVFTPASIAARTYPLAVAAALALLALGAWALDLAPARGIAEGFAWASRADSFMDTVQESAPLVGARAESGVLFFALGYGVLALPAALAWLAYESWRSKRLDLAPWIVAATWLCVWALVQRRFADPLAVPMSLALGLGAARIASATNPKLVAPMLCVLALASHGRSAASAWRALSRPPPTEEQRAFDAVLGERTALEWIRARELGERDWSVMTHWDRGHAVEWAADAGSVATNFGSYVGVESYRDPPRFFLSDSPDEALEILERRRSRFVFVPAALPGVLRSQIRVADPSLASTLLDAQGPSASYWRTMAGRLLSGGAAPSFNGSSPPSASLDRLRLVHVTRERNASSREPRTQQPLPAAFVWERVAGAVLEARGAPGEALEVGLAVDFSTAGYRIVWRGAARADGGGVARVRCPYATRAPNGDGLVIAAQWRMGAAEGRVEIEELDVIAGATVELER